MIKFNQLYEVAKYDGKFSPNDIKTAVEELVKMTSEEMSKIAKDSGYLDMKFNKVQFEHFTFSDNKLTASYYVEWKDDEMSGKMMKTHNFVTWDGGIFGFDVSGTSEEIEE